MRVKGLQAGQLLDAMESVGVDRRELLSAVSLDEAVVRDPRGYVEWTDLATMVELGWGTLGRDVERMRLAGRAMARQPEYTLMRGLARALVPVHRVYDIGTRWGARATMPHLSLTCEELSPRMLRFRGLIPEPYTPSEGFHHVFEGVLIEVPVALGLAPATIVSSRVTPRTVDVVIELPKAPPLRERLRRAVRSALGAGDVLELLEEQRRLLEEALAEAQRSTAENRELLERLPDYVMIHRDGVLLWLNRANVRALGYERAEELVGKPLLELVAPASRDAILARMKTPIGTALPPLSEFGLLTRDGRVLLTEVSPAQSVVFEGKSARLVVARDVTERAQMQEKLLVADRMASVGVLAAGVAHEVNNPLAYVLNHIELTKLELAPLGEIVGDAQGMLDVALEGVDRIRNIVRDLLALSRTDDIITGVDPGAVVESTLKLARKTIDEQALLTVDRQPTPKVAGNVARVGQVVLNLITNALQSMPPRPRAQNRLTVSVRPSPDGGAVIEVTDNGAGIAPEDAARVFEPFFTTKAAGKGTGLGLAICQRVVTEMGGQISFDSRPGEGTTFRVTLAPWETRRADGASAM